MLPSTIHDDLRRRIRQTILTLKFLGNGFAQFHHAATGRVFGEPILQSLRGGVLDMFRRVKVWLTRAKANHVQAVGLHLLSSG